MNKINLKDVPVVEWKSPKGKFASVDQNISEALGREPASTDHLKRHPFDVEICTIPAGKINCPYHSHSAQWEYYHVISGSGTVRHKDGSTPISAGDAFVFEPCEPHQLISDPACDLVLYIVADNPMGDSCHYPDSKKWLTRSPERMILRSETLDYFDGEE